MFYNAEIPGHAEALQYVAKSAIRIHWRNRSNLDNRKEIIPWIAILRRCQRTLEK